MLATLVIAATGDAEAAVFAPQAIGPNAFLPSCVQASFDAPRRPRVGYPMHATSQVSGPIVHDVPVRVKHFFTAAYLPICRATPADPPGATRTPPVSAPAEYMTVYDMNQFHYIVKSFSCQRQIIMALASCGLRHASVEFPTPMRKADFEGRSRPL
jgi:hypothetical protein